jgi:hypothetical protein
MISHTLNTWETHACIPVETASKGEIGHTRKLSQSLVGDITVASEQRYVFLYAPSNRVSRLTSKEQ